jgi:hypothetical protein
MNSEIVLGGLILSCTLLVCCEAYGALVVRRYREAAVETCAKSEEVE